MTTKINNEHKKLNFSSEREQSQACLNSAEHEKNQGRKVLNVPNLRFKEFQGEWEEKRLSEIADLFKGNGISKEQLTDTGEPCILYGELYTKYKSEVISDIFSKTDIDTRKLVKSKANDVIIPCSGETAVDIATARCVPYDNILLGGDLNIIRLYDCDGSFMSYQLNGKRKYDLAKVAQGVSVVHLYGDHLKGVRTYNPCLEEQKKIAKLLSLLDERIATQNKIIDKLQSLIKGIRHDIFKDIQGEALALSNIADIYQPQTISSSDLTTEGYWVYGANGIIGKYKEYNHETEQICITCRGNTCGTVNYTQSKVWITGNSMVINTDKYQRQVNKRFLFHYLSSYNFKSIVSGSGQPQIVRTPLEKTKVVLPTIEKQVRIANSIDIVSEKINTESLVLRLLENQKQYLLRQMFI